MSLKIKNLDQLVLLVRNWPDDPHEGCAAKTLDDFGDEEAKLIEQLEEEFEGEMNNLVEVFVDDTNI